MIKTVVFDLDDTLYDQLQPFKNAFNVCFSHLSIPIEELYISSRKHSDTLFYKSEKGTVSLLEQRTYRITAACKEFGININYEEAVNFQDLYQLEQQKITLFPEIKRLLDILHAKNTQLAILTNGPYQHQLLKIKQLQLSQWIPIDNCFISGAIGSAKPNQNAFLFVEDRLHISKNETVYIGDSFHNDIVGAKQVGWKAIWLNHRKREMTNNLIKPDKTVMCPKKLLDLLVEDDSV